MKKKQNARLLGSGEPRAVGARNVQTGKKDLFPIVGIGASAGGLEAFKQLLQHIPGDIGMAFVLVQHLAPRHESALVELLSKSLGIPVTEVKDGLTVKPNNVYAIPPNRDMTILNGILHLTRRSEMRVPHMPIDSFLRSLAADRKGKAIGVILSGTASDGTLGMKAIKAEGGITFAQSEESAKYPEMSRSAVAAGCIDFVLSPEHIARELVRLGQHPYITRAKPIEAGETIPEGQSEIQQVFSLLRRHIGVDFSLYKQTTIRRRMWRRMALHRIRSPREYVKYLAKHAAEVDALYQDILIHVTGFFRDPESFEALRELVFPAITAGRNGRSPVRIWVPGCSTGEEVYSIAIALLEFLGDSSQRIPLQFFATDISESAVERARAGIYLENIAADVSAERLRRFFIRSEQGFRISKSIRDMCVFARHDVTRDPPFSRLDLISCRNLLIYLGPVLQRKVLPFFVYALKPGGFLWLGTSEHIPGSEEYFTLLDKNNKIYSRKPAARRPMFDLTSAGPQVARERPGIGQGELPSGFDIQKEVDRVLLSKYVPAGVVVNSELEILQFRGRTGPFLEPAPGHASLTLSKMAREGLIVDVRAAVHKAQKEQTSVRKEGLQVRSNGGTLNANIEVVPLMGPTARDRYFIVLFEEVPPPRPSESRRAKSIREKRREARETRQIPRLKQELAQTKAALQSIIEEQETTNEELRSANEEILSSNEELQSTNEELETAKEELQSTNEELTTVNEELQNRNVQLTAVNEDLNNLLSTVNLPIVMVGSDLRIRRYTPIAEKILNIIPGDVGRPIGDIRCKVEIPDLEAAIRETIDSISTIEREVQDRDGRWYSLRIRPYRTSDNRIEGAVLTLLDIDALKLEANELRVYAESIVETVRTPLIVLDDQLRAKTANRAFYELSSVSHENSEGHFISDLGNGQWNIPGLRELLEKILPEQTSFNDFEVDLEFPAIGRRTMLLSARAIRQLGGPGQLILLAIDDITEHARSVEALRKSQEMFEKLFESSPDAIVASGEDGQIRRVNLRMESMFGYDRGELLGKPVEILVPERFRKVHRAHRRGYHAEPHLRPMGSGLNLYGRRKEGSEFPVEIMLSPLETDEGTLVLSVARDITERKRAEEALRLLVGVTAAASEAEDARTMTARCLEAFCRLGNWQLAQAWFVDERQNILRCDARAFYSKAPVPAFRKASLESTFAAGESLVGQAWKAVRPQWMADIGAPGGKTKFLRQTAAQEAGFRSAFALPIGSGRRAHAVWEFFSLIHRPEDPHFLEVAGRLGSHLAIVYERKLAEKTLSDLSARLMKSQDEERRRIARDLHDSTAQALAAAGMNLAAANRERYTLSPRASQLLAESARLVGAAAAEIRTMTLLLHPPALDQVGLASALRSYVGGFSRRSGIRVDLDIPKGLRRLPAEIETAFFRIVQEGLSNVHRHSQAKRAKIRIIAGSRQVALELSDRGQGAAARPRVPSREGGEPPGLGIAGMRERVKELAGRFDIRFGPQGTMVKAVLPLQKG